MLACSELSFSYNSQKTFNFPSFSCEKGQTLLILGNSGTGKTTLLHLLALLLQPKSGSIQIKEHELAHLSAKEAAQMRANHLGIVYQKSHFVSSLSVLDNLLLANYLADQNQSKEQALKLAQNLGFADLLDKKTTLLSGGEQQRVSIARALMNNPDVILADEPTSNLDDENCEKVVQLLENQSKNIGAALVIVTHDHRLKNINKNIITL
ncbi:Lipoprotein-releasing system ATP-binding protein LolD [Emticicia aquatica]|jgi:putative ABC transport system ATP-binding protein|uniref:Lipoprotein-releasing system ATP-binding protein LolD n=1 Tax=Emticicia aquatica TaxID=1681835 RepID=A0ABM9ANB6_9BACT|nr:ATP-binding cassette domain-containing protein [Emticicia aquatica]CAH0995254.1 Lipoprotein-releasing system ATP-binding protein LolD [Emticicia aquatica]